MTLEAWALGFLILGIGVAVWSKLSEKKNTKHKHSHH